MSGQRHQHGGPRPGSGRPRKFDAPVKITIVVDQETIDRIDQALRENETRSDFIRRALEAFLGRKETP